MKLHENILNCFQVIERTQFCDRPMKAQTIKAKTMSLRLSGCGWVGVCVGWGGGGGGRDTTLRILAQVVLYISCSQGFAITHLKRRCILLLVKMGLLILCVHDMYKTSNS